jgi:hypothetical protein
VAPKHKTHFEQVPVEMVKKIAQVDEQHGGLMPTWQELYQKMVTESDAQKLTELVLAVEQAIFYRAQELNGTEAGAKERAAMDQAARKMLAIKTEKLGWPGLIGAATRPSMSERGS